MYHVTQNHLDGVGECVSLIDGNSVRDSISRVEDDTRRTWKAILIFIISSFQLTSGSVKREDGLDVDVHRWRVERLEHDLHNFHCLVTLNAVSLHLRHLLPVDLGVEGGLRQQDGVLLRRDSQLIVESVMPDLLHVIPVRHDSVLDRVLECEDT